MMEKLQYSNDMNLRLRKSNKGLHSQTMVAFKHQKQADKEVYEAERENEGLTQQLHVAKDTLRQLQAQSAELEHRVQEAVDEAAAQKQELQRQTVLNDDKMRQTVTEYEAESVTMKQQLATVKAELQTSREARDYPAPEDMAPEDVLQLYVRNLQWNAKAAPIAQSVFGQIDELKAKAEIARIRYEEERSATTQLKAEIRTLRNRQLARQCAVCLEEGVATMAFAPCGHLCLCTDCALQLPNQNQCPTCRTVGVYSKIYLS